MGTTPSAVMAVLLLISIAVERLTVVLRNFDVRSFMGGLVVVSGVEAVTIAVVAVVSMSAIAIAMAIDAIISMGTVGGSVVSMSAVYAVATVSRSAVCAVHGVSMSTIAIGVARSRVITAACEFMLPRTSRHLSNSMTELMVINGPMVCHNCRDSLLRR